MKNSNKKMLKFAFLSLPAMTLMFRNYLYVWGLVEPLNDYRCWAEFLIIVVNYIAAIIFTFVLD